MNAYILLAMVGFGDYRLGWLLSQFQSLKALTLLANVPEHAISLLETRKEVRFYTLEEAIAEIRGNDTDFTRAQIISSAPQDWADLEGMLKREIEAFHLQSNSPAG